MHMIILFIFLHPMSNVQKTCDPDTLNSVYAYIELIGLFGVLSSVNVKS